MIIKVIKTALIFMKNMITLIRNRKIIQSPMTILISIPNIPIMVMSIPNTHMIVISIQINAPTMINIPILTLMNLLNLISTTIQTIPIMFQIILTSKQL